MQTKLLRVLQEGEFERLGNPRTLKVDVRVIAATNRDLEKAVEDGTFREDLFYRLNVFPIHSPPLRDRIDDIPLLVRHFVQKFGAKIRKKIDRIPKRTLKTLQDYHWPGNVRELENVIERALILSAGTSLVLDEAFFRRSRKSETLPQTLPDMERLLIQNALKATVGVIEGHHGAAVRLNISPSTLRDRMKKYGIEKPGR